METILYSSKPGDPHRMLLQDNYRATQPLNHRVVFASFSAGQTENPLFICLFFQVFQKKKVCHIKSFSVAVDRFDYILQIEKQAGRNVERYPTLEDHKHENQDWEFQRKWGKNDSCVCFCGEKQWLLCFYFYFWTRLINSMRKGKKQRQQRRQICAHCSKWLKWKTCNLSISSDWVQKGLKCSWVEFILCDHEGKNLLWLFNQNMFCLFVF